MTSARATPRPGAPTFAGGIGVLVWPAQREMWAELVDAGTPRLLLVEDGAVPPVGADCSQDWMWQAGDARELRLRLRQLSLRVLGHGLARPRLDSLGLLHVGLRSVALPPKERTLAATLLDRFGEVVPRDELVAAAWPGGIRIPNVLASRISSLRSRLACVGLEIVGTKRDGYALRAPTSGAADDDAPGGFDDELEATKRLLIVPSGR